MEAPDEQEGEMPAPTPTLWESARARRHRFQDRYEQRRLGQHHLVVRPVRIALGVFLILLGLAVGWLPGPGFIPLALGGSLLLASEVRRAALILDRMENEAVPRFRKVWGRIRRGGPKPGWVEEHPRYWGVTHDRRDTGSDDSGERRRRND